MRQIPKKFQLPYAFALVDVIHFVATGNSISAINQAAELIDVKNHYTER